MSELHDIVTFWDGSRPLHYIHHICLESFVRKGHSVTLYALEPYASRLEVPRGVTLKSVEDFQKGMNDRLTRHNPTTASDFLRVLLVRDLGAVWIDTDVFCVKPFLKSQNYIFAHEGTQKLASAKDGNINNAVLAFPRDSEAIKNLAEYAEVNLGLVTSPSELVRWYIEKGGGHPLLKHGPRALTFFLDRSGEISEQMLPKELYPVHFNLSDCYWDPEIDVTKRFLDTTIATHIWDSQVRPGWYRRVALDGSFIANAAHEFGIDMNKYRRQKR